MSELHDVEVAVHKTCKELGIKKVDVDNLFSLLSPLRNKNSITQLHYLHTLRVGMLARQIGKFIHHEERPLFLAGCLHDLGKCECALGVLGKSENWTKSDTNQMKKHVRDGYHLLAGKFDFSAEVMVLHHQFQSDPYPKKLPRHLHKYSRVTKLLIQEYGRLVAIADVYDALHRINDKFGKKRQLAGKEIKTKMLEYNPDRKKLILALYEKGILSI